MPEMDRVYTGGFPSRAIVIHRKLFRETSNHMESKSLHIPRSAPVLGECSRIASPPLSDKFATFMEIETRDEQYVQQNQGDEWEHGINVPYTVFNLKAYQDDASSVKQDMFLPEIVLEKVAHAAFGHPSRVPSLGTPTFAADVDENIIKENHSKSSFAGYYSIPKFSMNVPLYHNKNANKANLSSLTDAPKLFYQNHYDLDELTYTFGGYSVGPHSSLSYLGIPKNTPLEKISVRFPCKLPPFVNKKVLTNPLITDYNNFFMFNPLRGSVTYLDSLSTDDPNKPANINALMSCQISPKHIFFYGGFLIVNEKVEYLEDIERWVIHKNLVLNKHGFILDTISLSFSKIELKGKESHEDVHIGRLGASICSNLFESTGGNSDLPARVPSPPLFTNSANLKSEPVFVPRSSPKLVTIVGDEHEADVDGSVESPKISKSESSSSSDSSTKFMNTMSNLKTTTSNNSLQHTISSHSNHSNSDSVSSKGRVGSVLSKSSKIFHRNHNKTAAPSPQKSAVSHALKSTYSSHVRDHRSNSSQTLERPKSPLQQSSTNRESNTDSEASRATSNLKQLTVDEEVADKDPNTVRTNLLFNETIFKSGINSVAIFVFGGFYSEDENGVQVFKASSDLLKIDLGLKEHGQGVKFHNEALVCNVGSGDNHDNPRTSEIWPSPRGYFASTLVNYDDGLLNNCAYDAVTERDQSLGEPIDRAPSPISVFSNESATFETESRGSRDPSQTAESFFRKKALLVQGGCNEQGDVFSDLYLFEFSTGKWQEFPTYAFDYFEKPKSPYEDDDGFSLLKENEVEEAQLVEAELRSCHHTALYYQNDQRDFIFFMGGFKNDYLRHFDKVPYESDKFDISRISKFPFAANNDNILRIPMLNLQNQTWTFLRYYYDVNHVLTDTYVKKLDHNPIWVNAAVNNYAGSISLNGKSITVCHGLCTVSTEKKEDMDKLKEEIGEEPMLWGTHIHFTFPSL